MQILNKKYRAMIFTLTTIALTFATNSLAAGAGNASCSTPSKGPKVQSEDKVKIEGKIDDRNLGKEQEGSQGTDGKKDYVSMLDKALKEAGGKEVKCTSGYRSPEEQAAACKKICKGATSCPGLCAAPCHSQHQKELAVCDLKGIASSPQEGCQKLKEICDKNFDGKCGIGGYGGDAYHFGVGDDHFSAWNKCGFLKGNDGKAASTIARSKAQISKYGK